MTFLKTALRNLGFSRKTNARDDRERAKAEERRGLFESDLWQRNDSIARRHYGSYEDYLRHQSNKLTHVRHRLEETSAEDLAEFQRRFSGCGALREMRSVLCLGARLGTEVKALHMLGHFAVGIDLNPGSDNELVLRGDFHRIVFPDGTVDAVYTNSLDHVFDLGQVTREVHRVLRPDGLFIVDHVKGYDEGFIPGSYEATHWATSESLRQRICDGGKFAPAGYRDLGRFRRDEYLQTLFRKI
jgi:SAM-dependent methyltransferase